MLYKDFPIDFLSFSITAKYFLSVGDDPLLETCDCARSQCFDFFKCDDFL